MTHPITTEFSEPATDRLPEVRLADVLAVLVARLPLIAACTIGLALLAGLVALVRPRTYTATAVIVPAVEDNSTRAQLAAQIPGAELAVVEGGRHLFLWEVPEQVTPVVVEFLARH